jgi:hypothetical protein
MPVSWPSSSKMLRTSQLVVVLPALPVTPTTASFSDGLHMHQRIKSAFWWRNNDGLLVALMAHQEADSWHSFYIDTAWQFV